MVEGHKIFQEDDVVYAQPLCKLCVLAFDLYVWFLKGGKRRL